MNCSCSCAVLCLPVLFFSDVNEYVSPSQSSFSGLSSLVSAKHGNVTEVPGFVISTCISEIVP